MTMYRNNQRAAADRQKGHQSWLSGMCGAGPELLQPLHSQCHPPSKAQHARAVPPSLPEPCSIPPFAARQETGQSHPDFYSYVGLKGQHMSEETSSPAAPSSCDSWTQGCANRGSFSPPQSLLPPLLTFSDNNSSNRRWRRSCNLKS